MYELKQGTKFKLGQLSRFTAEIITSSPEKKKKLTVKCMKCNSDGVDGLLFPCRHHVVCY